MIFQLIVKCWETSTVVDSLETASRVFPSLYISKRIYSDSREVWILLDNIYWMSRKSSLVALIALHCQTDSQTYRATGADCRMIGYSCHIARRLPFIAQPLTSVIVVRLLPHCRQIDRTSSWRVNGVIVMTCYPWDNMLAMRCIRPVATGLIHLRTLYRL